MLKRIDVTDLELGMFVHKLEGNWFKHPFWKAKFVLEDERTLDQLLNSDVPAVIIDTERGLDVRPAPAAPRAANQPNPAAARLLAPGARRSARLASQGPATQADPRATAPLSLAREFGNASRIADRSSKVISRVFLEARFGKAIEAAAVEPLVEDIFASVQRNPHAFNGLMRCKRDGEWIYRHALAVSALMITLGRQMGLGPEELRMAGMTGLLIDVGVGHLPIDLAALGGDFRRLDPRALRDHVQLGHDCLEAGGGLPEGVARACLEHHERMDGTGYPNGRTAADLSQLGRMAAICDAFDWLVDGGVEGSIDPAAALERMTRDEGAFDAELLAGFATALGTWPVGSVVLLKSGRLALVVAQDEDDASLPLVRTFFSARERRPVKQSDIALARCFGEDAIAGPADPAEHGCTDFAALREKLFASAAAAAA